MTARGICPGCLTEQDVTSAGLIGPHSSCLGKKEKPVVNEEVVQRAADEMAKKIKQVYGMMPYGIASGGGGGSSSTRNSIVTSPRRNARKTPAEAEADVKPAELCSGGDEPKAGCKDCGDIVYMRATGQDERFLAHSYEWWRRQHIEHGTDWAKERMLDFIRPEHQGVLDPAWTGEEKPRPWEQAKKVPRPLSGLSLAWIGIAGIDLGLFISTGSLIYLLCVILYTVAITFNQIVHTKKRRAIIAGNKGKMIPR